MPTETSQRPARTAAALQKGQATRAAILDAALGLASHMGLEGLSIGALAEVTQMSKSGVFAHFGSREELQISVIREYHAKFEEEVFYPALKQPRGLPRLRALFERWVKRAQDRSVLREQPAAPRSAGHRGEHPGARPDAQHRRRR